MKFVSHPTTNVVVLRRSRAPSKPAQKDWFTVILDALYESRRREAARIIRRYRHLFTKPEHVALFKQATGEEGSDGDR